MLTSSICRSVKDQRVLAQQRHAERGALAAQGDRFRHGVFGVGRHVGDLDGAAFLRDPARDRAAPGGDRVDFQEGPVGVREPDGGGRVKLLAPPAQHEGHVGLAQPRGGDDQGLEHRAEIDGRAADDLQHVAGRGLIVEGFLQIHRALAQFSQRGGAGDGDDRLIGEGLNEGDLGVVEAAR